MPVLNQIVQNHLSILVLDKNAHNPIARMPIYAEISIVIIQPTYIINGEDFNIDLEQNNIANLVRSSLAEHLEEARFRSMPNETKEDLKSRIYKLLVENQNLFNLPEQELREIVDKAVVQKLEELELPISKQVVKKATYSYPLGYLATDHVGYASFDLRKFPENNIFNAGDNDKREYSVFVYPMGKEGSRLDALEQARLTKEAIFAKLEIDRPVFDLDLKALNLPSMQKPSLVDWYFSPGSFAAKPEFLVGQDGCEQLMPSQLALQQFNFRYVVRVGKAPDGLTIPADCKFGYVDEYRASWYSLGHSLGEILYSLPLAPGESVKLAVIDWSWDSLTKRDEATKLTENILHQTHRDRTITETVKATLNEWQRGGSFMAGLARSQGESASQGNASSASGTAFSLGGGYSTSSGSRDLAAANVQRLSDGFIQASSAQREINSTVVIQARQEEKESIQTRTFTNYNHSHTLTILYYEVLRHFKVEVEWVRRRPVLLKRADLIDLTKLGDEKILLYRGLIEINLLDFSLKPAFDALEKLEATRSKYKENKIDPNVIPGRPFSEGDIEFTLFEFGIKTQNNTRGDDTSNSKVIAYVRKLDGNAVPLKLLYEGPWEGRDPHNINSGERFTDTSTALFFVKSDTPVKWRDIAGFGLEKWGDDNWRIDRLAIRALSGNGFYTELIPDSDVDLYFLNKQPSLNTVTFIKRPGADQPAPAQTQTPEQTLSSEELRSIKKLRQHLSEYAPYYHRLIYLNKPTESIAIEFESANWDANSKFIDRVEPFPLEVFGSYVAYPLIEEEGKVTEQPIKEMMKAKAEKLITLPTRGVFAEGKLGHCNISEEIDNTRFWKWEEHPIPFEAPGINPVTPVTPQPQQTNIAPTPFPSSLVNIVSPSAAPDPTGLGEALKLLSTPNIFRDMSGRAEVADLLKKLSDNTISIAEAANKARDIRGKFGGDLAGNTGDSGSKPGGSSGSGGSTGSPSSSGSSAGKSSGADELNKRVDAVKSMVGYGDPKSIKDAMTELAKLAKKPSIFDEGAIASNNPNDIGSQLPAPRPASDKYLREAANVAFYDSIDIQNYFTDVTGFSFVEWFRTYVGNRSNWSTVTMSDNAEALNRFTDIWNAIPDLFEAGYATLVEFATLMAIFLNETGGNLNFRLAEGSGYPGHPGLSYPFEAFEIIKPDGTVLPKGSYNTSSSNRTAHQNFIDPVFLQAHGQLEPINPVIRNDPSWGTAVYPRGLITTDINGQTRFIQEADFYKFRGRGLIQLTFRSNYKGLIDFIKTYNGTQAIVTQYKTKWENLSNDDAATTSTNADWNRLFIETDMVIHVASIRKHSQGSGGYLPLSIEPAIIRGNAGAKGSIMFLATRIAGRNPEYTIRVRNRVLELLGAIETTPPPVRPEIGVNQ
jgi:uncharacterized membrane protein YgcG